MANNPLRFLPSWTDTFPRLLESSANNPFVSVDRVEISTCGTRPLVGQFPSSIDDNARIRKQSRTAGQRSPNADKSEWNMRKQGKWRKRKSIEGDGEKEREYILANNGIFPAADGTDFKIVDAMGECALSRGQLFVPSDISCPRQPRRVCFHRGEVFFLLSTSLQSDRILRYLTIDFLPSW